MEQRRHQLDDAIGVGYFEGVLLNAVLFLSGYFYANSCFCCSAARISTNDLVRQLNAHDPNDSCGTNLQL
jgi:hypothetical protein